MGRQRKKIDAVVVLDGICREPNKALRMSRTVNFWLTPLRKTLIDKAPESVYTMGHTQKISGDWKFSVRLLHYFCLEDVHYVRSKTFPSGRL